MSSRNMNIKGSSSEVSDGNEEHVIGNWKKGNSCYKVTEMENFQLVHVARSDKVCLKKDKKLLDGLSLDKEITYKVL